VAPGAVLVASPLRHLVEQLVIVRREEIPVTRVAREGALDDAARRAKALQPRRVDLDAGVQLLRRAVAQKPSWLILLERLPAELEPAAEPLRAALLETENGGLS